MGYVFDFNDATSYDQWFKEPKNQYIIKLEEKLLVKLLRPEKGESVLDIGCGTGQSLKKFTAMGLSCTGIDPSPYMLDIGLKNLGNRVDFYRGYAEDLPFDDNSFNHACLVTTLEFVENPQKAIEEACRVAKDCLYIGTLNRFALQGLQRRFKILFGESIYRHARFFSVWELKRQIRSLLGDIPITWRTVNPIPFGPQRFIRHIDENSIIQFSPFGTFAGMVTTLVPRYKTRPLSLRYRPKRTTGAFSG